MDTTLCSVVGLVSGSYGITRFSIRIITEGLHSENGAGFLITLVLTLAHLYLFHRPFHLPPENH